MENKVRTNAAELRNKLAPLYCQYPSQHNPQPAYLELNPAERSITADYSGEIGGAVPFAVWHNHVYRLPIPAILRGRVVADLLENAEILRLAGIVCREHDIEWDGNNRIGYLTEAGADAREMLECYLSENQFSDDDIVRVWDVGDWLSMWEPTPGEDIADVVEDIEREAEETGILLMGDVLKWVQDNYSDICQ